MHISSSAADDNLTVAVESDVSLDGTSVADESSQASGNTEHVDADDQTGVDETANSSHAGEAVETADAVDAVEAAPADTEDASDTEDDADDDSGGPSFDFDLWTPDGPLEDFPLIDDFGPPAPIGPIGPGF